MNYQTVIYLACIVVIVTGVAFWTVPGALVVLGLLGIAYLVVE